MNIRFGRAVYTYFCFCMITLFAAISGGVYYYWSNGPADIDRVASVFESTVQLDTLEKVGGLKQVKTLVNTDRVRDAIKHFDIVGSKVKSLNNIQSIKEHKILDKNLSKVKKDLNTLLSYSTRTSLINVLRGKTSKFQNFVVENSWRTLTRTSKKINTLISSSATRSPGFFEYRKLRNLLKVLNRDINFMVTVTNGSVLSRADKNLILLKIDTFRTEIVMLEKVVGALASFNKSYANTEISYTAWLNQMRPTLALSKIKVVENSKYILYGMIALLGVIALLMITGIFIYRSSGKKQKLETEKVFVKTVKESIIPIKAKVDDNFSHKFKDEIEKYREYIHKRMSFGSIFQDAMPFSSILLDSNLNLVWANTLFYEHWNLEDKVKADSNVTWDFLQRFTNLGENDPVITAVKENIAGIYQIQVKTENAEETAPFEMYVSPVEYAGQKRIMVIFYPLRSIEETISNQLKSVVSPVSKTLDTILAGSFSGDTRDRIEEDFSAAGIDEIFVKFETLNGFYDQQRNGLMNEIENVENTLFDQYKLIDDMKIVFEGQKTLQKDAVSKFTTAKKHIVSVVELRGQFESMVDDLNTIGNSLFESEVDLLSKATDIREMMDENEKAMQSLVVSRDEFKKLRSQVELFRSRVGQILENARNAELNGAKGVQGMQRLKSELMDFENVLTSFSKVSTTLDVGLSKVQLIMESKEMPELSHVKSHFENLRSEMEEISNTAHKMSRLGHEKDEELVKSLKGLYLSFQNIRSRHAELEGLLEEPDNAQLIDVELEEGLSIQQQPTV